MKRPHYIDQIHFQLDIHPICGILGPRQVGKTTLAKMYIEKYYRNNAYFFDLENPIDLVRLENPMVTLTDIAQDLIVIDEIQLRPDLFSVLRVLVDQVEFNKKILILGSASRDLLRQSSQTLAGRIGYIELFPLSLFEVKNIKQLWLRGGFPRSYLADSEAGSYEWRKSYITTFLERDIPSLGFNIPAPEMRRFWLMLAHYHGQTFNAEEMAKSLKTTNYMIQKYLDILVGTFMVRSLLPWFESIKKRQKKRSKIYFRDSGILNALLKIEDKEQLNTHPRLGSFWEGFALEEVIRTIGVESEECYFWGTPSGAELDLFLLKNGRRLGFEFKYADAPRTTKSMHSALEDLKLDQLIVVYPGDQIFPLTEKIWVYGLKTIETGQFMKKLGINFVG